MSISSINGNTLEHE